MACWRSANSLLYVVRWLHISTVMTFQCDRVSLMAHSFSSVMSAAVRGERHAYLLTIYTDPCLMIVRLLLFSCHSRLGGAAGDP